MLFGSSRKSFQCYFFCSPVSSRYTRRAAWDTSRARMIHSPRLRSVVIRISYWSSSREFYVYRLYFHKHAATMCVRPLVPISKRSSVCSPAWCHSPFSLALYLFGSPALCVKRLESTARVRVGRLRGSPRSHLLSHLATIGVGRSPGPGPWSAAVVCVDPVI
jgi:hypothetical protein